MQDERLYSPSQVGQRLGLKTGMVRRYHQAYEAVTGEVLPRDPNNNGRLVSDDILTVLERARAIVRENPSTSAEDAIRATLGIATVATAPAVPNSEVLGLILEELQGLRKTLNVQNERMAALENENKAMIEQFSALPAPTELDDMKKQVAELEKRNQALRVALEVKEREEQERNRPWWRLWQRKKPTLGGG